MTLIGLGSMAGIVSGGKGTMLAAGIDETTAYGLLHDVSKILGFKIS